MKRAVFLASFLLLAASLAIAQDVPYSGSQDQNASAPGRHSSPELSTVQGCLSGSADNYTLTDRNGAHYRLVGQNESLAAAVGHEVEIIGSEEQSSEAASGESEPVTHSTSTFQVSRVEERGSSCKPASPSKVGEPPMNEQPPQPHPMAMLKQQQQASPDTSAAATQNSNSSSMSNSANITGQPAQGANSSRQQPGDTRSTGNPTQTTPPVYRQAPAGSTSPTTPNPQAGNSPTNNAGTNPDTGPTTGAGVNGSASPSTNPDAAPTSPNSTTPRANQNNANKPLYERQATDIPWARRSTDNQNNPNPGNTLNNQPSQTTPH